MSEESDDRQPRLDPHHPARRPPLRRGQLGRGRADPDLKSAEVRPVDPSCFGMSTPHPNALLRRAHPTSVAKAEHQGTSAPDCRALPSRPAKVILPWCPVLTKGADLGRPIFPHSPGASWKGRWRVRQMPRVYDPIGSDHLPDAGCGALLRATPPSCALPELS